MLPMLLYSRVLFANQPLLCSAVYCNANGACCVSLCVYVFGGGRGGGPPLNGLTCLRKYTYAPHHHRLRRSVQQRQQMLLLLFKSSSTRHSLRGLFANILAP